MEGMSRKRGASIQTEASESLGSPEPKNPKICFFSRNKQDHGQGRDLVPTSTDINSRRALSHNVLPVASPELHTAREIISRKQNIDGYSDQQLDGLLAAIASQGSVKAAVELAQLMEQCRPEVRPTFLQVRRDRICRACQTHGAIKYERKMNYQNIGIKKQLEYLVFYLLPRGRYLNSKDVLHDCLSRFKTIYDQHILNEGAALTELELEWLKCGASDCAVALGIKSPLLSIDSKPFEQKVKNVSGFSDLKVLWDEVIKMGKPETREFSSSEKERLLQVKRDLMYKLFLLEGEQQRSRLRTSICEISDQLKNPRTYLNGQVKPGLHPTGRAVGTITCLMNIEEFSEALSLLGAVEAGVTIYPIGSDERQTLSYLFAQKQLLKYWKTNDSLHLQSILEPCEYQAVTGKSSFSGASSDTSMDEPFRINEFKPMKFQILEWIANIAFQKGDHSTALESLIYNFKVHQGLSFPIVSQNAAKGLWVGCRALVHLTAKQEDKSLAVKKIMGSVNGLSTHLSENITQGSKWLTNFKQQHYPQLSQLQIYCGWVITKAILAGDNLEGIYRSLIDVQNFQCHDHLKPSMKLILADIALLLARQNQRKNLLEKAYEYLGFARSHIDETSSENTGRGEKDFLEYRYYRRVVALGTNNCSQDAKDHLTKKDESYQSACRKRPAYKAVKDDELYLAAFSNHTWIPPLLSNESVESSVSRT